MTRNDLEQAVYRRTNKATASPNPDTQTRVRHFINQRYRRLMGKPGAAALLDDTATFASVEGQSRYALANIDSVKRMWEASNERRIWPMSKDAYRTAAPDPDSASGTPTHFVYQGIEPVSVQPADASALFVKSTSASDTTQVAYVEVDITGGYPRVLNVTLTGTTAVNLSSALTTGERVKKFYLSATCAGVVTLHEDSGSGTELARIGIGQTTQRYWVFYLHPQPSAVITYTADVTLPLTDLAQNTDEPRLPERFHYLLELGAAMDEYGKTDDARYRIMQEEYTDGMKDLTLWLARQGLATGREMPQGSTLGAWFPAGS